MLDDLFSRNAPDWLNMLFEEEEKEIRHDLKRGSDYFLELERVRTSIYEAYPKFAQLMENDVEDDFALSQTEAQKLALLIRAETEIMEMYQRLFYFRGCRDGLHLAEYEGIVERRMKNV